MKKLYYKFLSFLIHGSPLRQEKTQEKWTSFACHGNFTYSYYYTEHMTLHSIDRPLLFYLNQWITSITSKRVMECFKVWGVVGFEDNPPLICFFPYFLLGAKEDKNGMIGYHYAVFIVAFVSLISLSKVTSLNFLKGCATIPQTRRSLSTLMSNPSSFMDKLEKRAAEWTKWDPNKITKSQVSEALERAKDNGEADLEVSVWGSLWVINGSFFPRILGWVDGRWRIIVEMATASPFILSFFRSALN